MCGLFSCEYVVIACAFFCICFFFFQAEDGIRDLVRSRGLGDVYKRQAPSDSNWPVSVFPARLGSCGEVANELALQS